MSTIIVPLDGSPYNERRIRTVRSFMHARGGDVELLYVLTPGHHGARPRDRASAERYLTGIALGLSDLGQVRRHIVSGRPVDQVLSRIDEVDDPIVVLKVGAFGNQGWISSDRATHEIIRRSSAPVVAIQPSGSIPTGRLERLLVPLDGSSLAESILPLAIDLAAASQAAVKLVWIEDLERISRTYSFSTDATGSGAGIIGQLREEIDRGARDYLTEQVSLLSNYGIDTTWDVLQGPTGPTINRFAWVQSSDLILMATHGRSRLGVLALGSITEDVLSQSKSPVLILPPRARERMEALAPTNTAVAA